MPVATITLTSANGDSVVVSAPNDEFLADEIILDTDPKGVYATGFKLRTQSGAFEPGGRIVGEQVPIRELVLPFWLTQGSRPRFQRLWGTPGNFHKVRYDYDGPSGLRSLILRLSKEIDFATEDGFDAAIDDDYHAVVSAIAVNPNFEAGENVAQWTNPDDRFTVKVIARSGNFPLTFSAGPATTSAIPWNATLAQVKAAVEALPLVGAGNVTVTGTPAIANGQNYTPGNYLLVFAPGVQVGSLTSSFTGLGGTGPFLLDRSVTINYAPNTGWFDVWNPTDQPLWPEWEFDPADSWQFPDFAFGQERKLQRPVGSDAARMIVTPKLTQLLSVMADPFMDTYVNADLSNAAALFNGVQPMYMVPPYTQGVEMPVVCSGPAGARATLRQRRFWSAESGLEEW